MSFSECKTERVDGCVVWGSICGGIVNLHQKEKITGSRKNLDIKNHGQLTKTRQHKIWKERQ